MRVFVVTRLQRKRLAKMIVPQKSDVSRGDVSRAGTPRAA
jgi:hypothetical protein